MRSNQQLAVSLLESMLRIRRFEEAAIKAYDELLIPGVLHSSVGQEAIAAGVCAHLRKNDYIISNHRGHGHSLAKGVPPKRLMAELFGRSTGCCAGIGGSMHVTDLENGVLLSTGIVGSGLPVSLGAGFSIASKNEQRIVACFFGEGASNTGSFHESLNLASLWKLPIVFVCENNQYALSLKVEQSMLVEDVSTRAGAYGMPGNTTDGNDVLKVYEAMEIAANRARDHGGPTLLECKTYRWFGHHMLDPTTEYRDPDTIEKWKEKCPIATLKKSLLKTGRLTDEQLHEIENRITREMDEAVTFARQSPSPSPESFLNLVYAEEPAQYRDIGPPSQEVSFGEAIHEAIREEMTRNSSVFLLGEDIGRYGGIFKITKGLLEEFGEARVRDAPISETAILGTALGAAMTGLRPVVEIMYMDFLNICMDQLVNHIAKVRFMSGGQVKIPVVIRTQCSLGRSLGAQHSQLFPSWFLSVPGVRVAVPSDPFDGKGLLKSAIRGDNPVLFIEMGMLYSRRGKIPEGDYVLPFGKAAIKREGRDVTVIALLDMVHKALSAASKAAERGIDVEVIDPRTVTPLDEECIIKSVKKTGRLIVAEEGYARGGIGAEIAAIVAKKAFDYIDSPIERIGAPDTPVPFSPVLQNWWIPSESDILRTIIDVAA